MKFFGLEKLFEKNSGKYKPDIKNALVSAKKLTLVESSIYDDMLDVVTDKFTSFKHLIELKEDIGKYKAGSIFKAEFRNECIFPSYDDNTGQFSSNETFRVDLRNWEKI